MRHPEVGNCRNCNPPPPRMRGHEEESVLLDLIKNSPETECQDHQRRGIREGPYLVVELE